MAIAIFPGSFDPITNGHVDLVERGLKMFDKVIVSVLVNPNKTPLFTVAERSAIIRRCFPSERVVVDSFRGLLVDFAREKGAKVIMRGLRAVTDFEYELQMAMMNRELFPELETVFLTPQTVYSYLSSKLVREVANLKGDISKFVPPHVEVALKEKFGNASS